MLYRRLKNQLNMMGVALAIVFVLILGSFLYNYLLTREISMKQGELEGLASIISLYNGYASDYIDGYLTESEIPIMSRCEMDGFMDKIIPKGEESIYYNSTLQAHEDFHHALAEGDRNKVVQASQKLNETLNQYSRYIIGTIGQMQKIRSQVITIVALPGLFIVMSIFILFYIRLQKLVQDQVIRPLKRSLDVLSKHDLVDYGQEEEPEAILKATERAARYIAIDNFRRQLYPFWNSVFEEEELIKGSIDLLGESQFVASAAFYRYDEKNQELKLAHSFAYPKRRNEVIPLGEGPIGEVARKNRPIVIKNPDFEINLGLDILKPAFLGYYPIKLTKLFGVIVLVSPSTTTDEEVSVMEILAHQLSIVMDRVHQLDHLKRLTEELQNKTQSLNKELSYKDSILNSSADGIAIMGIDGKVKLFSKGAEEITGFTAEEAVGSDCCDIFGHLDENLDKLCLTEFCANYLLGTKKTAISGKELFITNRAGEIVPILFSAAPLYNDQGEVIEILQIFKDVTDLKNTLTQLEEANRSKTEFLASMSHELRTPLNAILGFAELLELETFGPLNDRQKRYASNILTAGNHLLLLINDLLDISRIESGKMEWELGTINIPQLFSGTISLLREKANRKNITLSLEIEEGYQDFIGDERKMKQIIFNLVNNSIKFTPSGGKVGVKVYKQEDGMGITVTDTGIGIPFGKEEAIFEPFYRVDTGEVEIQQGTGLGLPLVKKIVTLPGGDIWLDKTSSEGSTFKVYIPDGEESW